MLDICCPGLYPGVLLWPICHPSGGYEITRLKKKRSGEELNESESPYPYSEKERSSSTKKESMKKGVAYVKVRSSSTKKERLDFKARLD